MTGTDGRVPVPTADSEEFWDGCGEGELRFPRCRTCGHLNWFPRAMCAQCSGVDLEWITSEGRGRVYSFSVVHRASDPGMEVPYVLALVDVDGGPRMMSHVVDCDPAEVRIGQHVTVRFRRVGEGIALPVFSPV